MGTTAELSMPDLPEYIRESLNVMFKFEGTDW
jgi:hypothetical protein